MRNIARVTNPNKLVEEKINYFLDRLMEFVTYAGTQKPFEIENPSSLLEKVMYQINHNKKHCAQYLSNYFSHIFFTQKDYWIKYSTFIEVREVIAKYNSFGKNNSAERSKIIANPSFISSLKQLHSELKNNMIADLVKVVLANSLCKHQLNDLVPESESTHAESFRTVASMLGSEYIFRGHTVSEIKEIVSNVFSKDINKFPFPTDIIPDTAKETYLNESSLEKQLMGFANVFNQRPRSGIAVIKVYGGSFPEIFRFTFNKVRFWGKGCPEMIELKENIGKSEWYEFFSDDNYILAETELTWMSQDTLFNNVKRIVQSELEYLSARLHRNFSADSSNNILILGSGRSYEGIFWSTKDHNTSFDDYDLIKLNDNAYETLRSLDGNASDWFLSLELLFISAHKNRSPTEYWIYLEALLPKYNSDKKVKDYVSTIILTNETDMRDKRILFRLLNSFDVFDVDYDVFNISNERRRTAQKELREGIIPEEMKIVTYPYIKELVEEFQTKLSANNHIESKNYYHSILTEAYEFRNISIHSGLSNETSNIKLSITLPHLVSRLRVAIFNEFKEQGGNVPFVLLIDNLLIKGNKLLVH